MKGKRLFSVLISFMFLFSSISVNAATSSSKPDLIIYSIILSLAEPTPYNNLSAVIIVQNVGAARSSSATLLVVAPGYPEKTLSIPQLNVGATKQFSLPLGKLPLGTHMIDATVDPKARVSEKNETNNKMDKQVLVKGNLYVYSNPSGAQIYVDNVLMGNTPAYVLANIGPHNLTLTLLGYNNYNAQVSATSTITTVSSNLTPSIGNLSVTSTPTGADLFVDGTPSGTTPKAVQLPTGNHLVRVSLPLYTDYETSVSITSGQTAIVNAALQAHSGTLSASSNPIGADAYVDGSLIGQTPINVPGLQVGQHSLMLKLAGYADYNASFFISSGGTTPVSVTLAQNLQNPQAVCNDTDGGQNFYAKGTTSNNEGDSLTDYCVSGYSSYDIIEGYCYEGIVANTANLCEYGCSQGACQIATQPTTGNMTISSSPQGASIFFAGSFQGVTPTTILELAARTYTVVFSKHGYYDHSENITVVPNQVASVFATLTAMEIAGAISATSSPPGASISIDGVPRGASPLTATDLSGGSHLISASLSGYYSNSTTAVVYPSSTTYVSLMLTQTPATCNDSDGGINYATFGTATRSDNTSLTDYCVQGQQTYNLVEAYCIGSGLANAAYQCEFGCSNGACQTSTST